MMSYIKRFNVMGVVVVLLSSPVDAQRRLRSTTCQEQDVPWNDQRKNIFQASRTTFYDWYSKGHDGTAAATSDTRFGCRYDSFATCDVNNDCETDTYLSLVCCLSCNTSKGTELKSICGNACESDAWFRNGGCGIPEANSILPRIQSNFCNGEKWQKTVCCKTCHEAVVGTWWHENFLKVKVAPEAERNFLHVFEREEGYSFERHGDCKDSVQIDSNADPPPTSPETCAMHCMKNENCNYIIFFSDHGCRILNKEACTYEDIHKKSWFSRSNIYKKKPDKSAQTCNYGCKSCENETCTKCYPGFGNVKVGGECSICSENHYSTANNICESCPARKHSVQGATQCCNEDQFSTRSGTYKPSKCHSP